MWNLSAMKNENDNIQPEIVFPKFHYYPGTMTQKLSSQIIDSFSKPGDLVLDPFCGAGNNLRVARAMNRQVVGVDINPLAVKIAEISLASFDNKTLQKTMDTIRTHLPNVHFDLRFARDNKLLYWFNYATLNAVESLNQRIEDIADSMVRSFFKVSLSSMIRSVSRADPYIAPPVFSKYMRTKYVPLSRKNVLEKYVAKVERNMLKTEENNRLIHQTSNSKILNCDGLDFLADDRNLYDMIFTSPPYAAAQKYVRSTSLELMTVFRLTRQQLVDMDRRDFGSEAVRKWDRESYHNSINFSNVTLLEKYRVIYERYLQKMQEMLTLVYERLDRKGTFVLVVSENATSNGEIVPLIRPIIEQASKIGLNLSRKFIDPIRKRNFSIKRNRQAPIMKSEFVLVFRK